MKLQPIAERILDGEPVCMGEVWERNAQRIYATEAKRAAEGPHDPKGCRKANCTHNQGSNAWYADELLIRAARDCTCTDQRHGSPA